MCRKSTLRFLSFIFFFYELFAINTFIGIPRIIYVLAVRHYFISYCDFVKWHAYVNTGPALSQSGQLHQLVTTVELPTLDCSRAHNKL